MASSSNKGRSRGNRATPSAANRGAQTRPGDATGMEQQRLQRENEAAIKEAATRTTLAAPPPVVQPTDDVVDYSAGGSPHTGNEDAGVRLITMEEATADGATATSAYDIPDGDIDFESLPDGKTDILPEMVERTEEPQPAHQRQESQQPQPRVEQRAAPKVEQAFKILRVNTDLEDVTIGKDNHFTFRFGVPYKVPTHVWEHLYEKGYVLH